MVTIRRTLHFALLATLLLVGFTVPTQASTISAEHSASLLARLDTTNALFSYGGGKAGYLTPGRQVGHGWGGFDYGIQIDSLNGGRYGDVIVRSPDGILRIYHSDGTRLSGGYQIGHGWQSMSAIVAAEDWDKDGHPDIIASTSDGRLMLYPTRGAGNWGATRQIGQGWDGMDMLAVPGDLTGDGNPDLIAREKSTGYLYLYAGTGRGGFASRTLIGHGWKNFKNLTSFGDMDGDGIPDMIGQHENGRLYRYSGTGRGWWKPAAQIGHGWGDMSLPGQWKVTAQVGPPAPKPKPLRQPFVYGTLRTGDRGYHMVQGRSCEHDGKCQHPMLL